MGRNNDEKYMRRALKLAAMGAGHVSPNPMVGAVIVAPDGRIIGEGFHRKYGSGHAEVNAFASVRQEDEHLVTESTIYVTLEPCSHYGKTPPCAKLLCDRRIRRAVIGTTDPNPKVAGRGIRMLREAGVEVTEHVLERQCRDINVRFFTAHTKHRPWILLKWVRSADGYIAAEGGKPVKFSTPLTMAMMHRERSMCDAILVGTETLLTDNPGLDNRLWPGNSPRPVIFDSPRLDSESVRSALKVFERDPIILDPGLSLAENMHLLFAEHGVTSLMVEGGARMLRSFIDAGLYDRIRVETSPIELGAGIPAPVLAATTDCGLKKS